MTYLSAAFSQHFSPGELPPAVRAVLGKPLRRAAVLSQLAVLGALAGLPADRRQLPTALLWQTTGGARAETLLLLDEVCAGSAEPLPYDFLATQPAIAAAQLKAFLPGLRSATCCPLASSDSANWSLLFCLADTWLQEGRYAQILCAHLDHNTERASGHWLALTANPLENPLARLQLPAVAATRAEPDTPDFPAALSAWLNSPTSPTLHLHSAVGNCLAVEFSRS
ncbi:MAG: hypothetical protein H6R15_4474 [Proteobacteria bacterium]|nr:hypothetical protein [Pseudomonadota bacterium]